MIEDIRKQQNTAKSEYKFSLLIPSWNNLDYLQLCVNSIRKNSHYDLQIIVIVNEGSDGTIEWVESQKDIDFVYSKTNIGICYALNITRSLIKSDYVMYINDDMYLLPNWDLELDQEISKIGTKNFMLSSTMVEPVDTGNPCVIVKDYGTDLATFNEELLLKESSMLVKEDWSGASWPPNVMHVDLWDLIGGYSIEFSPGMGSDPDVARKLYEVGVRYYKGVGTSLVYHFGTKSTKRVKKNNGRNTFMRKWGITQRVFSKKGLLLGAPFTTDIKIPELSFMDKVLIKIKIMMS